MSRPSLLSFEAASRRVIARLVLAAWFRLLGRTAWIVFPGAIVAVVGAWGLGIGRISVPAAVAAILFWLALAGIWAWLRRPSPVGALAYWDQQAGRQEMFTSAWCFERRPAAEVGEALHLARANRRLAEEWARMGRDLPARLAWHTWVLPLAFWLVVFLLPRPAASTGEPPLDDETLAAARQLAGALTERLKVPEDAKGLSGEEERRLKELRDSLKRSAEKLAAQDGLSQREVLAELDARAHEAEELAAALEGDPSEESSSRLIDELERHADTTDFASAHRGKDLGKMAEEARKIGDRLDQKDLSLEERRRIEQALSKALKGADTKEKQGLLGKHLERAHQKLLANQAKAAAGQFKQLAGQYSQAQQRKNATRQLQQLANQWRQTGQQIFGQKPAAIQRLGQSAPASLRRLGALPLQPGNNPGLQQQLGALLPGIMPPAPGGMPLAIGPPGQGTPPGTQALASGSGPPPGSRPAPGSAPIPVPGTGQGLGQGPGQGQNQGQEQGPGGAPGAGQELSMVPVPGTGAVAAQGAGVGGLHAGHGTAPYGTAATRPLEAKRTGAVDVRPKGDGPSQIRSVEGKMHREQTHRNVQAIAGEAIRAEEEAIADEPLPASRREQVLRYFTALRRQLLERDSSPPARPD